MDGVAYDHDVVIDRGEIRKRRGKNLEEVSRTIRPHTSVRRGRDPVEVSLVGDWHRAYGSLPVMKDVSFEAEQRKVELVILPTEQAIKILKESDGETNAILHVKC